MEGQTVICGNCQAPNPAKNLFCQACGKPLAQQVVAAPPPPPTGQPMPYPQQPVYPAQQAYPPQTQPAPGYPAQPAGYPPQQAGYYPPAPAPAPSVNLGTRLDGWVSVIEGAGEKAADVEAAFVEELKKWNAPQVNVQRAEFPVAGQMRGYQMVNSFHGLHAVNFQASGPNLQVSWGYYKRLQPNWPMIGVVAGVALAFSLVGTLFMMIAGYGGGWFFGCWLSGVVCNLALAILACALYGLIFKGSLFAMFVQQPDALAAQDAAAMSSMVHQSIVAAVEKSAKGAKLAPKSNFRAML